jgi:opacity protein-like surface antigen
VWKHSPIALECPGTPIGLVHACRRQRDASKEEAVQFTRVFTVLLVYVLVPLAAFAQARESDGRIAAFFSGAVGDGGPAPAVGVTAGYRVLRSMRVELDATYVPRLDFGRFFTCPPDKICAAVASFPFTLRGDAVAAGGNVVGELPWRTRRIRPYVVAGAGIAHVRRTERQQQFNSPVRVTTFNSTGPLLTAGGGVDILLGNRLALGADARYQRMFETDHFQRIDIRPNLDLVRIGSSLSYRF